MAADGPSQPEQSRPEQLKLKGGMLGKIIRRFSPLASERNSKIAAPTEIPVLDPLEIPRLDPSGYPEDDNLWPGEPPLAPSNTRLYRGENVASGLGPAPDWPTNPKLARKIPVREEVRFFTENRFDAEDFAHMLSVQGRKSHVVYIDVPTEQARKWAEGKKDTGDFEEVLVPADIARGKLPVPSLPKNWKTLMR